jgi:hypothetical protein
MRVRSQFWKTGRREKVSNTQVFFATIGIMITLWATSLGFTKYYIDAKFDAVSARFDTVNVRLDAINSRLDRMSKDIDILNQYMISHEKRITTLEQKTRHLN